MRMLGQSIPFLQKHPRIERGGMPPAVSDCIDLLSVRDGGFLNLSQVSMFSLTANHYAYGHAVGHCFGRRFGKYCK